MSDIDYDKYTVSTYNLNYITVEKNTAANILKLNLRGECNDLSPDDLVCLESLKATYFFPNITVSNNNSQLAYTWPDQSGTMTQYPVYLLTGANTVAVESIKDMNTVLRNTMTSNSHFTTSSVTGTNTYYLNMYGASAFNKFYVQCDPLPATGSITPAGSSWKLNGLTPQIIFPNNNLSKITLGFNPQTFPSSPTSVTSYIYSDATNGAQITNYLDLFVECNLMSNSSDVYSREVIAQFSPYDQTTKVTDVGAPMCYRPYKPLYFPCKNGMARYLEIKLMCLDINGNYTDSYVASDNQFRATVTILKRKNK
jgi:hypothetical protein